MLKMLVAVVEDDGDVDADEDEGEDDAANAEAEGQMGAAACLARPHFGRHPVAGGDGRSALGRAQDGEDADQPAAADRHEDRVAHVVVRRILQGARHALRPPRQQQQPKQTSCDIIVITRDGKEREPSKNEPNKNPKVKVKMYKNPNRTETLHFTEL